MAQNPPQDAPVQPNVVPLQGGAVIPVVVVPNDRIVLKWFVEFVQREDDWGYVENPGPGCDDHNRVTERTDKNDKYYKQYINLDKDVDGEDHRHPEYDQYIQFQACVKWEDDQRNDSLEGRQVEFTYTRKNGKGRPDQLANHNQKDGFGDQQPGNQLDQAKLPRLTVDTNDGGLTPVVTFYLSRYGGDKFEIHAQAVEELGQGPSGQTLTIGTYEVWRKFWYQVTRPIIYDAPTLDRAVDGWAKVKADMVKTDEVTYAPDDDGVAHGTFYPEWQFKGGTSERKAVAAGKHNRLFLYGKLRAEQTKPVKAHVMLCHLQVDADFSDWVRTGWRSEHEFDHSVPVDNRGVVLEPPVQLDAQSAHSGTYEVRKVWERGLESGGDLGPDNFKVVKGRSGVNRVRITLPDGVPGANEEVRVTFRVQYVQTFLGQSDSHQMICSVKHGPNTLNDTVVHEIGHAFRQVARPMDKAPGLPNHRLQYESKGSHCHKGIPGARTCVMHATGHWREKATFCSVCHPYVRLKNMQSFNAQ